MYVCMYVHMYVNMYKRDRFCTALFLCVKCRAKVWVMRFMTSSVAKHMRVDAYVYVDSFLTAL
jgi:hypothetical protein